jgi:signal transduction histidine kinase
VFKNLIDNAIKFRKTDQPSIINISSSMLDAPESKHGGPVSKLLAVSIEDNGLGFADEEVEEIFQLFYKNHKERKLKGSGVGLAVAKRIMSVHGGYIAAESKVDLGSKFTCTFITSDNAIANRT